MSPLFFKVANAIMPPISALLCAPAGQSRTGRIESSNKIRTIESVEYANHFLGGDLSVKGLVIPNPPGDGTPGPVNTISASLYCGTDAETTAADTTEQVPISRAGDARPCRADPRRAPPTHALRRRRAAATRRLLGLAPGRGAP